MKFKLLMTLSIWPLLLFGQYHQAGTDSTIDILTWNIEWFAKNDQSTIDEVALIVSDLQGDLFALQEIASIDEFNQLVSQLSGWDGILSPHTYSDGTYQKVGLLFNSAEVTVHSWQLLFEDDTYAFPRPAMEFTLTVNENDHTFDFKLITVHLKAFSDEESEARRKAAINKLKIYIDDQLALAGEQDFVLLGDFNDHLEDAIDDNVFQSMLDDSDTYSFLTEPLAGIQGSYIGYNEPNLIDHICITNDALVEYGDAGSTEVLYLDSQNSAYESMVSDHRPVLAQFAFENSSSTEYTPIADIHTNFNQYQGRVVTVQGVVTIPAGIFSSSYTSVYIQDESEAGINIYFSSAVISDFILGSLIEVNGVVDDFNGLHEIIYQSHTILAENQPLPAVLIISTQVVNDPDSHPGCWAELQGEIESISDGPYINMMVNDESGAGKVYFDPDAGLDVSQFVVGETIRVAGVKTVYNYEGQLQPGYQDDIEKVDPSAIEETITGLRNFSLSQNYPNPFNPSTVINYQIPVSGQVNLAIYNSIGQKISVLIDKRQKAGYNSISVDASEWSSGIYYYRLQVGEMSEVRKMILMR